jgi:hypothetical protein
MKKNLFVIIFAVTFSAFAFCKGAVELNLVNTREINLGQITTIDISYHDGNVALFMGDSDVFIIKEFMNKDNSGYYARITDSVNEIKIESGNRPIGIIFSVFKAGLELYLPKSYVGNIIIKTRDGIIQADDSYTFSTLTLESSDGNISLNRVIADTVSLKTNDGKIYCRNIQGAAKVNVHDGTVVFETIDGDLSADISDGRIDVKKATGMVTVNAKDANTECAVTETTGDISLTSSDGNITLDIPRNLAFHFNARISDGRLSTPFSERLVRPYTDKKLIQGDIGITNSLDNTVPVNINIKTTDGSVKVNWIN